MNSMNLVLIAATLVAPCFAMEEPTKSPSKQRCYAQLNLFWQLGPTTFINNDQGNLKELKLANGQLRLLVSKHISFAHLTDLDLSHNEKLTFIPTIVYTLTTLKKLNCSHCKITEISEQIGNLKNLEHLAIRNNKLTNLPNAIATLSKLEPLLDISCNQISSLPDTLPQLSNLQILNISHNQLADLPATFCQFTKLTDLNMSGNKNISRLPLMICTLVGLKKLSIAQCGLASLPEQITRLTNLSVLSMTHASYNPFKRLPPVFELMSSKTTLTITTINEQQIKDLTTPYANAMKQGLFTALESRDIRTVALQWEMGIRNGMKPHFWKNKDGILLLDLIVTNYVNRYACDQKEHPIHTISALSPKAGAAIGALLAGILFTKENNGTLFHDNCAFLKRFLAFAYL